MTRDTEEFSQFKDSVACREYTLPRDENSFEPKRWIRGNTKIGPVIGSHNQSYLQGKYGVEIRIESINKYHSHSWVRIPHGLNKLVTDLSNKGARRQRAGSLRDAVRRLCVEIECTCFCEPIKGQSKTTKTRFCRLAHPQELFLLEKKLGMILNQQEYSISDYEVSKQLITLLRHGSLPREDDGAIEFWRRKDYLRNHFVQSQHWSDEKWKSTMAKGGGNKKIFQYCTDPSEKFFTSELFKVIQDAISLILHYRTRS